MRKPYDIGSYHITLLQCPQKSALMDEHTVLGHLRFCSWIYGFSLYLLINTSEKFLADNPRLKPLQTVFWPWTSGEDCTVCSSTWACVSRMF